MTAVHRPYDLVFLGMGCANTLLLRSLHRRGQLQGLRLCVVEPNPEQITHKTFCFWSTPEELALWDLTPLISKSWVTSQAGERTQSLTPYAYHHISGERMLTASREILKSCDCDWVEDYVLEGSESTDRVRLRASGSEICGLHFFDSRPPQFDEPQGTEARLLQSFWGWNIQTDTPQFDPECCTLMDFNIPQNGHTQFMYVLPFTETTALVECTRFGRHALTQPEANELLGHYIQRNYGEYRSMDEEQGVIPMCSARQVPGVGHPNWIDTGGRAGNIKPSTGYSFISSCRDAERIASKQILHRKPARFSFYDRLLLHLLEQRPLLGKPLFIRLFKTTKMPLVVRFLREETTVIQELPILAALPLRPFLGAAFRDLFDRRIRIYWPLWAAALMVVLAIQWGWHSISAGLMVGGLLLIGLPHGAIDHLLETGRAETPIDPVFIMRYLLLSAAIGLIWWMSTPLGLLVFLIYSAWHFGETEYQSSHESSGFRSFLWGVFMLGLVLGTHPTETTQILAEMKVDLPFTLQSHWGWGCMLGLMALNLGRGLRPFLGGLYALTLPFIPLIHAFGLYFLFDHSYKSALQIGGRLRVHYGKLYTKAIPFTLGAVLLGCGFYVINVWQTEGATGLFFILLSCLSFPHVLAMTRFYQK